MSNAQMQAMELEKEKESKKRLYDYASSNIHIVNNCSQKLNKKKSGIVQEKNSAFHYSYIFLD